MKKLIPSKINILFILFIMTQPVTLFAHDIQKQEALNMDSFQSLWQTEKDFSLMLSRDVLVNKKEAKLVRYQPQNTQTVMFNTAHISLLLDKQNHLLGLTRMLPQFTTQQLPNKDQAQHIADQFIATYAQDLQGKLVTQWVDVHDETVQHQGRTLTLKGMKVKMRNQDDGLYTWVIIGYDQSIMVFERDIEWDFLRAGRKTQKWLHDSWLNKQV